MKFTSWKEKEKEIYRLIKKLSSLYHGDDEQWLNDYCHDIVEANKHDLGRPLECFKDLERIALATGRVEKCKGNENQQEHIGKHMAPSMAKTWIYRLERQ